MNNRTLLVVIALIGIICSRSFAQDDICFECHSDPEAIGSTGDSLYVDSERWGASIHAQAGFSCTDCHTDLAGFEDWPHPERLERVQCGTCHDGAMSDWEKSAHGEQAIEKNDLEAAHCNNCHGNHYIVAVDNPQSTVYPLNQPATCLKCHADINLAAKHKGMGNAEKAASFLNSIHGKALSESGLVVSATCSSCHGSHKIQSLAEHSLEVPKVCGKCHTGIYNDYVQGVHGSNYLKGNTDVPVCTDCHGEHEVLPKTDPNSKIHPQQIGKLCSSCHEDIGLSQKYGFALGRYSTYMDSYHGIAMEHGDLRVANCASCHGFHDIRPSDDPKSSINPANLAATCGKCHPNAGENFIQGKIHVMNQKDENIGAWLVKTIYIILISSIIGGFIAYIIIDLAARKRRKMNEEEKKSGQGEDK